MIKDLSFTKPLSLKLAFRIETVLFRQDTRFYTATQQGSHVLMARVYAILYQELTLLRGS